MNNRQKPKNLDQMCESRTPSHIFWGCLSPSTAFILLESYDTAPLLRYQTTLVWHGC